MVILVVVAAAVGADSAAAGKEAQFLVTRFVLGTTAFFLSAKERVREYSKQIINNIRSLINSTEKNSGSID